MKVFLPVVLLALLWQIMPAENLFARTAAKAGEHEFRGIAAAGDTVAGLFAPEGISHPPFVAAHGLPAPAPATSTDVLFDEAARPFLARAVGVVSGLPPPAVLRA